MAESKISSANLNFEDNKIEFLDKNGNTISDDSIDSLVDEKESDKMQAGKELTSSDAKSQSKNPKVASNSEATSIPKKIYKVARTMMRYSPLGMTYVAGKDFLENVDRMMNGDEISHEHINLDQLVELIRIGKYKFDELNMAFDEMQAQDINVRRLRTELDDDTIEIHFQDKDGGGLDLNIKYQGAKDD